MKNVSVHVYVDGLPVARAVPACGTVYPAADSMACDAPPATLPFAAGATAVGDDSLASAGRRDPLFYRLVKMRTRLALRRRGVSGLDAWAAVEDMDDETIDAVAAAGGPMATAAGIGDGKILDAILEFLRSEQGQALIAALVKLLLGLLAA